MWMGVNSSVRTLMTGKSRSHDTALWRSAWLIDKWVSVVKTLEQIPTFILHVQCTLLQSIPLSFSQPLNHSVNPSVIQSTTQSFSQSLCYSVNHLSFSQPLNHSINPSVIRSIPLSFIQSLCHSVNPSVVQSLILSFSHSLCRSFTHSVLQSLTQSFSHSLCHSVNPSVNHCHLSVNHSVNNVIKNAQHVLKRYSWNLLMFSYWTVKWTYKGNDLSICSSINSTSPALDPIWISSVVEIMWLKFLHNKLY